MQVFIDDNPVDTEIAGNTLITGNTLEDAVRFLQNDVCAPGRLVVALRCDGHDVDGQEMAATLRKPAQSFQRLEIFTGTAGQLVCDALTQASAVLVESADKCGQASDLLSEGSAKEGTEKLAECIGIWQQVHDAVTKSIAMLNVDGEQIVKDDLKLADAVGRPREALLQVRSALQARDYVLLSDLLQIELQETMDIWHAIMACLRSEAIALDKRINNQSSTG